MYYACMTNVQIRDVPADVHEALVAAEQRRPGQSLQQYLAEQLAHLAATPTVDEVIARIEARANGHFDSRRCAEFLAGGSCSSLTLR